MTIDYYPTNFVVEHPIISIIICIAVILIIVFVSPYINCETLEQ
jgi:hypothetical protein